ncbi:transglycosylase [Bacillus pseudomycoides]|uniref:Transglycosylase n=1 Tax=Bacillus bingmayongensis TaxID=1150157 RepID=A0ABU5JYX0_9BACI|nr:transglycosylase [Bacillus pseudomycoides]
MKPVKAKCEKCDQEFRVHMHTIRLPNRVDKHYFICPHCKTEFVSYYSNREIRQLQKEISKLYQGFRKCYTKEQADALQAKIDIKDAEFKWLRDKLRAEVEEDQ